MDRYDGIDYPPDVDTAGAHGAMDNQQRRAARKPPELETLDRVRRIETRLTAFLVASGIPTDAQKPVFDPGSLGSESATLKLPSPHSSMREILDSIPVGWHEPVGVFVGDQLVATINRPGN